MNGLDIVKHGVDMLLRNLGPALRISAGPFLIALVVVMLLGALGLGGLGLDPASGEVQGGFGLALGALLSAGVFLFVFSWVAVAWHRFVLKEEMPDLLPPLRADLIWPYLGRSVLIALILVVLSIPVGFVLGLVMMASQSLVAGAIVALGMWLVLGWVGTRLSLVLPARAVERPMTFSESWGLTSPVAGAIFAVVLALALLNVILNLLIGNLFGAGVLAALLSLVVQWFSTMLGLSVLTTLYGHLVERRPLAV